MTYLVSPSALKLITFGISLSQDLVQKTKISKTKAEEDMLWNKEAGSAV